MDSLLNSLHAEHPEYTSKLNGVGTKSLLEILFVFACTWTIGNSLTTESRRTFSFILKELSQNNTSSEFLNKYHIMTPAGNLPKKLNLPMAEDDTIFDYTYVICDNIQWAKWCNENFTHNITIPGEKVIRTIEMTQNHMLMDLYLRQGKPVLLLGAACSTKTICIKSYLSKKDVKNQFNSFKTHFSSHTTTSHVYNFVMENLESKRKDVFAPSSEKEILYFIDDVSMPAYETYGAQSPIELIRLWLEHKLWYNLKEIHTIKLSDVQVGFSVIFYNILFTVKCLSF